MPSRLFVAALCATAIAIAVGITILRPHHRIDHRNSMARMAPAATELLPADHRRNRNTARPGQPAPSLRLEPIASDAASDNPDSSDDPDRIRAWARNNPQSARDWLAGAPAGAKRDTVAEMVCLHIAETNPATAVAFADLYGAGCSNVLENLMVQWAEQDVAAAYAWAMAKTPGKQRDDLMSRIAFVESKTDPKNAAIFVAEQIPPGPSQDEAAISVLYQWALKDPQAAMNWAQSFSAGTLHDRAVNEVQNIIASNSR